MARPVRPGKNRHVMMGPPAGGSFRALITAVVVFAGFASPLYADYPLISYAVSSRDPLYRQQQEDVEAWYLRDGDPPPLTIYRYRPLPSEDLFSVSAAFNIPYDTLATLNGWEAPSLMRTGEILLVPNAPGLFVPENPVGVWERFLVSHERSAAPIEAAVRRTDGSAKRLLFYAMTSYTPEERGRFLGALFTAPLSGGRITGRYGYRPHPVTGEWHFHPGVDIKIPSGTPVTAAREGIVSETGMLETYGFFVILDHEGGYQSVYAHLDEILVTRNQRVEAGVVIALSGNSGISTGPHLHFEIRRDGKTVDPARLANLDGDE